MQCIAGVEIIYLMAVSTEYSRHIVYVRICTRELVHMYMASRWLYRKLAIQEVGYTGSWLWMKWRYCT